MSMALLISTSQHRFAVQLAIWTLSERFKEDCQIDPAPPGQLIQAQDPVGFAVDLEPSEDGSRLRPHPEDVVNRHRLSDHQRLAQVVMGFSSSRNRAHGGVVGRRFKDKLDWKVCKIDNLE